MTQLSLATCVSFLLVGMALGAVLTVVVMGLLWGRAWRDVLKDGRDPH